MLTEAAASFYNGAAIQSSLAKFGGKIVRREKIGDSLTLVLSLECFIHFVNTLLSPADSYSGI